MSGNVIAYRFRLHFNESSIVLPNLALCKQNHRNIYVMLRGIVCDVINASRIKLKYNTRV